MVRLKLWQWVVLGLPLVSIVGFLMISAGVQIHEWGINWIWAVITVMFVVWRLLLVKWTQPALEQMRSVVEEVTEELEASAAIASSSSGSQLQQAEAVLQQVLEAARNDPPIWEDWSAFWNRCQELIAAIAQIYHPEVEHPFLNIYVPQAYNLIRGTVNDLDQWMDKLGPALNQVTVAQAVQAYGVYRKLEPSARKLWQVWNWAQWLLNPAAAVARQATQRYSNQATQQLLVNLAQLLKEAALRNLSRQAIALYSGQLVGAAQAPVKAIAATSVPEVKTQTLREILSQVETPKTLEQKPVNILLVGRTGAGKSSLINTLFVADRAEVDVLPTTDAIRDYHWQAQTGEALTLWDSPGYEQASHQEFRDQVLDRANGADLLLLVTPALDPALQMDVDFLQDVKSEIRDLPTIAVVTQVDRLRPIREWDPPYDWEWGDRPKETAIREATEYRAKAFREFTDLVLPLVTWDAKSGRAAWGVEALSLGLVEAIAPAKQLRLARFLRNLEARTVAAVKIIDHYTFQMATTQGLATLLKSPVLSFISTLTTGTPTLARLLAEQIPVEQLPIVVGKLQMAYDLFSLLSQDNDKMLNFDLLTLWPLLLENSTSPDRNAWAFGHAITEYWTQSLSTDQFRERFNYYLNQK